MVFERKGQWFRHAAHGIGKSKGRTKGCPALDRVTEAQNYARTLCFTTSKVVPQKTFSGVEGRVAAPVRRRRRTSRVCGDASAATAAPAATGVYMLDAVHYGWLGRYIERKKNRAMYALLVWKWSVRNEKKLLK